MSILCGPGTVHIQCGPILCETYLPEYLIIHDSNNLNKANNCCLTSWTRHIAKVKKKTQFKIYLVVDFEMMTFLKSFWREFEGNFFLILPLKWDFSHIFCCTVWNLHKNAILLYVYRLRYCDGGRGDCCNCPPVHPPRREVTGRSFQSGLSRFHTDSCKLY